MFLAVEHVIYESHDDDDIISKRRRPLAEQSPAVLLTVREVVSSERFGAFRISSRGLLASMQKRAVLVLSSWCFDFELRSLITIHNKGWAVLCSHDLEAAVIPLLDLAGV